MPNYKYACKNCDIIETKKSPVSERKVHLNEKCLCGSSERFISLGATNIVSGVTVKDKRSQGWKDILQGAHDSAGKHSTINT